MKKISACPSWLNLSEDRRSFIFLPDRAEVVKKIFELSIGGLGSYAIANVLNKQKVPPFGPYVSDQLKYCATAVALNTLDK
jgi:hypothetical protein